MDTTTINGLHSCKPGNDPIIGQVKLFVIEHRKGKTGRPYIKIRSANEENGGTPHRILNAEKTDFVDQHGNISFNLEVEESTSAPSAFQQTKAAMSETRRGEQQGKTIITKQIVDKMEDDYRDRHGLPDPEEDEPQSSPPRSEVATPIDEVRKRLMQAVNLEVLCIRAVDKGIAPHCPEIAHTAEFFQSQVASLFIWATRQGLENKMPETPIQ